MDQIGVKPYTVCLAKFRFLESEQFKVRPVIVARHPYGTRQVVAVIPISSSAGAESIDVVLQNWQAAGLLKASVARVHRISATLLKDLLEEIGSIDKIDQAAIKVALKELLIL
jgi:mRNA-degrading endonuclease toxin of MazEF toxin-antitoxin module